MSGEGRPKISRGKSARASTRGSILKAVGDTYVAVERTFEQEEVKNAVPIASQSPSNDLVSWMERRASQVKKREESPVEPARVSFLALLSYSTVKERWLMALGLVMAAVSGSSLPAWLVLLAKALDKFNNLAILIGAVGSEGGINSLLSQELLKLVYAFAWVGAISLVAGTSYVFLWTYTGERQALRIKQKYVDAALRQDAAWFDANNREELPTKIANSMGHINGAIGRKMCDTFANLWASLGCLAVALTLNAPLALIMLCVVPIVSIVVAIISIFIRKASQRSSGDFASAGAIATEAISGIKTVASLRAEKWAIQQYEHLVRSAQKRSIYGGFLSSLAAGLTSMLFYGTYTIAFMIGTEQVASRETGLKCLWETCGVSGADVMTCIYGVILCATFFGLMTPGLQAINLGRQAAVDVFATIKRRPTIDASSDDGIKLPAIKGKLELRNVIFAYPSRLDNPIFRNFDLVIAPGTSVALVGPSGSGKSTISKLLLRFYDAQYGQVLVDDTPITALSLKWWRSQIGYVAQEPILFPGTIAENISAGKPNASRDDVIAAAKAACAHEFIMDFPQGYDTFYSGTSIQLSGGQMQRISIARAMIRDPAILLLDEATSALDSNSEKQVQDALENVRKVKAVTTVTVAHRLSTIVGCDKIAVIADGAVRELGDHGTLLRQGGIYATLCKSQGITLESNVGGGGGSNNGGAGADADGDGKEESSSGGVPEQPLKDAPLDTTEKPDITKPKQQDDEEEDDEDDFEEMDLAPVSRLWQLNKPEWFYMTFGIIGACAVGALPPAEGILTAQIVANFYILEPDDMRAENLKLSISFLALALTAIVGNIALGCGFSVSGFRLTRRLRVLTFNAIVRRPMGWFDVPEHSTGELTSRLEQDAEAVSKVTGWALGYRVRVFATLTAGVLISLLYSWQIGLVAIGCVPLIMGAAVIQSVCSKARQAKMQGLSSATILEQGLRGISNVQAYDLQDDVSKNYSDALHPLVKGKTKEGLVAGLVYGFSQFAIFISFALLFYVGAMLLVEQKVDFASFFTSLLAVMFGALGVAQVNADFNAQREGQAAAARIFSVIDEPLDSRDPFSEEGLKPDALSGEIVFKSCCFHYPTRPEHPIYYPSEGREGLSLTIPSKQSVAFVGKSGSGKSTGLQLLLRFYDASGGEVLLDSNNVQNLNLSWLRGCIGYVGQSPVLFAGTVRSNILLGNESASEEEMIEAAKAANAHDFITKLSNGYDTDIGSGGSLLSGGQKQRVAIARAIVKNPKILVLDEATSALDNESERIVQAALDNLQEQQPRTTLVVAHRLVTVKKCDKIAVLGGGGLEQVGSHDELLDKGGLYKELWSKQGGAER